MAGLVLAVLTSWWLLLVGAVAIAAAWGYTGTSAPYGYRGLGEVSVFVFFGLVAVAGTAYVQRLDVGGPALEGGVAMGALSLRGARGQQPARHPHRRRGRQAHPRGASSATPAPGRSTPGSSRSPSSPSLALALSTPWALLGLLRSPLAVPPLKAVRSGTAGRALVPVLGMTGTPAARARRAALRRAGRGPAVTAPAPARARRAAGASSAGPELPALVLTAWTLLSLAISVGNGAFTTRSVRLLSVALVLVLVAAVGVRRRLLPAPGSASDAAAGVAAAVCLAVPLATEVGLYGSGSALTASRALSVVAGLLAVGRWSCRCGSGSRRPPQRSPRGSRPPCSWCGRARGRRSTSGSSSPSAASG